MKNSLSREEAGRELKALEDEVWNKKIERPSKAILARIEQLKKIIDSKNP
ncbi:hypothetical protein KW794_01865 [Candidatus Saccharibacteria bacterium]|nr:hypothetical protein [Candidatus Saccharibacteria bacterium]